MKEHLKYLSYVIRHKWFVYRAGRRTGAPIWRLLVHDWSKFLPSEWFPYVRYFYGDYPEAAKVGRVGSQFCPSMRFKEDVASEFDYAWNLHQKRQPHHWQFWVLTEDSGKVQPLAMPFHFVCEMVADWAGAGRAITGKWEVSNWYEKNKDRMTLHPTSREQIEALLSRHFPKDDPHA